MRFAFLLSTLALSLSAPSSWAEDWPHEADIPKLTTLPPDLLDGGSPDIVRFLKVRGIGGFSLSPDGERLIFSTSVTGEPQLWSVAATGGWPEQLTYGSGVTSARWTPDGKHILYAGDTNGDEREGYTLLSEDGRRERLLLGNSSAFRSFGDFAASGKSIVYASTERNGRDFDIWVTEIESGVSRVVYEGHFGFFPGAVRPGHDQIILSETRGEDGNNLHLLDLKSGDVRTLFNPEISSAYESIAWKSDGSGFYLSTNHDREFAGLAYYDVKSAKLKFLESPDADIEQVQLSFDDRYLVWLTNDGGYSTLHVRDLKSGKNIQMPALPKGVYALDFAAAAPVLGIRVGGPQLPGDVFVWDLESGQLSHAAKSTSAGIDMASLAVPDSVYFEARDGERLHGLFYKPEAENPPVMIFVHGGPSAQARPRFNAVAQYLLGRGVAVLDLNFRGSTGFGKRFARLDNKRLRTDSVRDVADAVAWLKQSGDVDGSRIGLMGGSYGGYLTNAALGSYPDLFTLGVSFVGVSDWVRALETASPALKASDREEYGDIEDPDDRAFFASISPINNADKIKAPIMVLHGANDPRDPVAESDHLVEAIRNSGGEAIYLRFPDEGHGIRKLRNRVHAYHKIAAFLEEHFEISKD